MSTRPTTRYEEALDLMRRLIDQESKLADLRINGDPGTGDTGAIEAYERTVFNMRAALLQACTTAGMAIAGKKETMPPLVRTQPADAEAAPRGLEETKPS